MNEKPRMDRPYESGVTQRLSDGSLFDHDDSGTVDLEHFLSESSAELSLPRLTLRHADDFEDDADLDAELDAVIATPPVAPAPAAPTIDSEDTWPWNTDLFGSKSKSTDAIDAEDDSDLDIPAAATMPRDVILTNTPVATSAAAHHTPEDDHSAIEDVLLSMPLVQTPIQDTLDAYDREDATVSNTSTDEPDFELDAPEADENIERLVEDVEIPHTNHPVSAVVIAAAEKDVTLTTESSVVAAVSTAESVTAGGQRPAQTPKRIGSGQLVPARLTWKPGDPFGDSDGAGRRRFRWDVMLTSAGITAACGMFCIWVLRTLLA